MCLQPGDKNVSNTDRISCFNGKVLLNFRRVILHSQQWLIPTVERRKRHESCRFSIFRTIQSKIVWINKVHEPTCHRHENFRFFFRCDDGNEFADANTIQPCSMHVHTCHATTVTHTHTHELHMAKVKRQNISRNEIEKIERI